MSEQTLARAKDRSGDRLEIPNLSRRARLWRAMGVVFVLGVGAGVYLYLDRPAPVLELYRTDAVKRRTLVQRVEATGSVDVRRRVEVPAPIAGRLLSIAVQTGDEVHAGQLLASLDERAAVLALDSARAALAAAGGRNAEARAAHDAAQRSIERVRRLHDKGLASALELEEAQSKLERAKAALEASRGERELASHAVESAKLGKSLGAIVAPTAGIVLRAPERVGAAVGPERGPLFVLGDALDVMRIDAAVGESEIAQLVVGQAAEVSLAALPGERFAARVEQIAIDPIRDKGLVQYPVVLSVDNPKRLLRPGMSARVELEVGRVEGALSVHDAALRFAPPNASELAPLAVAERRPGGAPEVRARVWRRVGPTRLEAVDVRVGLSDGVYTAVEPLPGSELSDGDLLAIGLLRPDDGTTKPQVSLGKK